MVIDTHAHVVPGSLIETLRAERRLFPSVRLHDGATPRMEFAGAGRAGQFSRSSGTWHNAAIGSSRPGSIASWSAAGPMSTAMIYRARRARTGRDFIMSTCVVTRPG